MKAQVERMLKDPRANTLVENFALAWLNLDELEKVDPTDGGFNAAMRGNFETEIRLFLASVLLENRSVIDLLDADWTFLNEPLARQYDIPGVPRPAVPPREARPTRTASALLGKGAFLLRTSYGDRTSPVLRGAWVLDKLIGTPPAPPPPNVNTDLGGEGRRDAHHRACAAGSAPQEPELQGLPWPDRPAGPRAGELRQHGPLAHGRRSRRSAPIDASTVLSSGVDAERPDRTAPLPRRAARTSSRRPSRGA